MSYGGNPTFGELPVPQVECHIHNFDGDLYGQSFEVCLIAFIRSMRTFVGAEALVTQADQDVAISEHILQRRSAPDPAWTLSAQSPSIT